jgi:hypothetical protein
VTKFRVQYYGPTIYVEAKSEAEAEDKAYNYFGGNLHYCRCGASIYEDWGAEEDDSIPDDMLIERDEVNF